MQIDRRQFAGYVSAMAALAGLSSRVYSNMASQQPLFVATWNFGLPACQQSLETLNKTKSILDAIEMGIRVAEADTNVDSVGVGGAPNANGSSSWMRALWMAKRTRPVRWPRWKIFRTLFRSHGE
jgi:N4-(beta-N-acetylglucosaminyl)-L-asparaginase